MCVSFFLCSNTCSTKLFAFLLSSIPLKLPLSKKRYCDSFGQSKNRQKEVIFSTQHGSFLSALRSSFFPFPLLQIPSVWMTSCIRRAEWERRKIQNGTSASLDGFARNGHTPVCEICWRNSKYFFCGNLFLRDCNVCAQASDSFRKKKKKKKRSLNDDQTDQCQGFRNLLISPKNVSSFDQSLQYLSEKTSAKASHCWKKKKKANSFSGLVCIQSNGDNARYIIEFKVQWKPFWLATQQHPLGGNFPHAETYAHGPY